MPEESGPRSVMPMSIGTISSPSCSRKAGFFTSSPTIPHMRGALLLEHFQIALGFPAADVA